MKLTDEPETFPLALNSVVKVSGPSIAVGMPKVPVGAPQFVLVPVIVPALLVLLHNWLLPLVLAVQSRKFIGPATAAEWKAITTAQPMRHLATICLSRKVFRLIRFI